MDNKKTSKQFERQVKKNHYLEEGDPSWLNDVLLYDDCFKDYTGWQKILEPRTWSMDIQLRAMKAIQEKVTNTIGSVLSPFERQLKIQLLSTILSLMSRIVFECENLFLNQQCSNLAAIMNSFNAIILSYRFQHNYDTLDANKKVQQNTLKMHFYRKFAAQKLVHAFVKERTSLIQAGKLVGNPMVESDIEEIGLHALSQTEQKLREKFKAILLEKKNEIKETLQSHDLFQVRQYLSEDAIQNSVPEDQKEMVEFVLQSGLIGVVDVIFSILEKEIEKVFQQSEQLIHLLLAHLIKVKEMQQNNIMMGSAIFTQKPNYIDDNYQEAVQRILEESDFHYHKLKLNIKKYISGFMFIINPVVAKQEGTVPTLNQAQTKSPYKRSLDRQ